MRVLPRTEFGNPILRTKAKTVPASFLKSQAFAKLEKEMIHTMRRVNGVGLAAPQVGVPMRMAVMEMRKTPTRPNIKHKGPITIVNPTIVSNGKTKSDWEGCLSLSGVRGSVPRADSVTVSYTNRKGEKVTERASGLWARIFQHEIDHLNGVLYVDRMRDMQTLMTESEFKKRIVKTKA